MWVIERARGRLCVVGKNGRREEAFRTASGIAKRSRIALGGVRSRIETSGGQFPTSFIARIPFEYRHHLESREGNPEDLNRRLPGSKPKCRKS